MRIILLGLILVLGLSGCVSSTNVSPEKIAEKREQMKIKEAQRLLERRGYNNSVGVKVR